MIQRPMATISTPPKAGPGRPRLTAPQALAARQLLAFVTRMKVSHEAQLLALIIAVRAATAGQANLTSLDMKRYTDPQAALDTLVAGGWITGDVSKVVHADPTEATLVQAPGLTGLTNPPMGKHIRTRVSGWITRTIAAKPLKKTDAAGRLAALQLLLYTDPVTGRGVLSIPPDQPIAVPEPGWIIRDATGSYQLSEIATQYLPAPN